MGQFDYLNDYNNHKSIIDAIKLNSNVDMIFFVCDECGARYKYFSGLYSHKMNLRFL